MKYVQDVGMSVWKKEKKYEIEIEEKDEYKNLNLDRMGVKREEKDPWMKNV